MAIDIDKLSEAQMMMLMKKLTPKTTKYFFHTPTPKQSAFLLLDCLESLYGGSAGGGKSDALMMAALQYVDTPGYAAILFRKTYADLSLPEALMDRAKQWLAPYMQEVHWSEKKKTYTFPSGATLTFGYLDSPTDKYVYQGSAFQFIGFDELTQLTEDNYRYMFSRLRRLVSSTVPLRIRAASNPGGVGHSWVKNRFITKEEGSTRIFIPAGIDDNPYLNSEEYAKALENLDPVTQAQLRDGNWDIKKEGAIFSKDQFEIVDIVPAKAKRIRFWDFASTIPSAKNKDPDWTVGLKLALYQGIYYIEDIRRVRALPSEVENLVYQTACLDGVQCVIRIEQEPGSSGAITIDNYQRKILNKFNCKGVRATGSKILRAERASVAAGKGLIKVKSGPWIIDFFDEAEGFPDAPHDDQIDGLSGAFDEIQSKYIPYAIPIGTTKGGGSYWAGGM